MSPDDYIIRILTMVCETELRLRKVVADAVGELDRAESGEQSATHRKMVNARLEFVNHKASCLICTANHRDSEGLVDRSQE